MIDIKLKSALPYIGIPVLLGIFILLSFSRVDSLVILLHCLLIIFGYIIAVIDYKSKTIPNNLVLAMLAGWVLIVIPQLFFNIETTLVFLRHALFGLLVGGGLSILVYLISRKGLGGGDVKFIAVTGLYVGMNGILSSMLFGSVLAGLTGLILIIIKKIGRKDTIPLAPFLYIGILITVFFI